MTPRAKALLLLSFHYALLATFIVGMAGPALARWAHWLSPGEYQFAHELVVGAAAITGLLMRPQIRTWLAGLGVAVPDPPPAELLQSKISNPASSIARVPPMPIIGGLVGLVSGGLVLLVLALTSGCISSAPIVPQTPDNQNAISTCQAIATTHNAIVFGDFVLAGGTSALAGVAAGVTDAQAKTDLAIAAAVAGGLALAGTALSSYTAADFGNSACGNFVGALPPALPAAKAVSK